MAIVTTIDDSVFDLVSKLHNNGFEIIWIIFNKQDRYFSVVITRDNYNVKIINFYTRVIMVSSNKKHVIADKVLINDDLSFEAIK